MTKYAGLALLLTSVLAFGAFLQWRRARVLAAYSAGASLQQALTKAKFLAKGATVGENGNAWRIMSPQVYDEMMAFCKTQEIALDAPKRWWRKGVLYDPWEKRFKVAYRGTEGENTEYIVWSDGPDEISGTRDDVVSPRNAKTIVQQIGGR